MMDLKDLSVKQIIKTVIILAFFYYLGYFLYMAFFYTCQGIKFIVINLYRGIKKLVLYLYELISTHLA